MEVGWIRGRYWGGLTIFVPIAHSLVAVGGHVVHRGLFIL